MAYLSVDKSIHEDFVRNILASGPASIAVISHKELTIHYYNHKFESTFCPQASDGEHISLRQFIDEPQQLRLKANLQLVYEYPEARDKYTVYYMKTRDHAYKSFYVYIAPVTAGKQIEDTFFQLLILPDLSKWPVPFTSFDTRELFLEQFNNINFGTFEWIIPVDKIFWSDRVYEIYDIDDRTVDLTREMLSRYTDPADKANAEQLIQQAMTSGKACSMKMHLVTAKNNHKVVDVIVETLNDENGQPLKLLGSIREITEEYKTEEDLKRNVIDLNRSNKELEEFAYVASHDLQEPLRKISTFSDRLSERYKEQLEGEGKMYLERIIASADSMRMLIDNLLDFSRLSRSTQPFTEVNLGFVLREVLTELELVIEETGTTIKSSGLPEIAAVHSQMKQLFMNILNNAIKFRKPGVPPEISIDAAVLSEPEAQQLRLSPKESFYKIQIIDNGIGFEPEYAEKIFQIFQRLHAKSEYPGTGIGLAICKKIADNHRGLIYAENLPGQGANFTVILPAKQQTR
ncbi:MAG: PAS domain-containing protein [Bacteroidetes bacterium]|nr:PAS domain-containing protein [Bacteroidota bacterium]